MPKQDEVEERLINDIHTAVCEDPVEFEYERIDNHFIATMVSDDGTVIAKYKLVIELDRIE